MALTIILVLGVVQWTRSEHINTEEHHNEDRTNSEDEEYPRVVTMVYSFFLLMYVRFSSPSMQEGETYLYQICGYIDSDVRIVCASSPRIMFILKHDALLKVERNKHLILPGETDWAFGQVLSLVMIAATLREVLIWLWQEAD
jgi:hypothetical protein